MRRRLLPLCVAVLVALAGCGGDDDDVPAAVLDDAPTTERTTTTRSVEAEVEAAYLRSWDVYADAVRTFDTSELDEVYDDEALELRAEEVADLKAAGTPVRIDVRHNVRIVIVDDENASVLDDYENHSVLLDGDTGEPIEPDPNQIVKRHYVMRKVGGAWKVARVFDEE